MRGSTEAIGIVYPAGVENLGNPQFLDMAGGLSERLLEQHFDQMLAVSSDEVDLDLDIYDRLFRGGRVYAVVLPNTRVEDTRVNYLLEKGFPFRAYGRSWKCSGYSWFDFDNDAGSKLAVRHFVAFGHSRIAYVHSPLLLNFALRRHRVFLAGFQEAGLSFDPACLAGPAVVRRSGREAVPALMALEQRRTAIVVDNNLGGIGVMRSLMDQGLRFSKNISAVVHGVIPADSLLVGLDATMVTKPTAHSPGVTMADMVLQVLSEPTAGPFQTLRQSKLMVGQTTGPRN